MKYTPKVRYKTFGVYFISEAFSYINYPVDEKMNLVYNILFVKMKI